MNVTIKYAAGSDIGCVRENNEDSAYAGSRLIAVADGMGGYAGGEVASSTVIGSLRSLDVDVPVDDLENALARAVAEANEKLRIAREERPDLSRMGTTLTAMLWSGRHIALAHIGDSRGYMLRNGELFQITQDHTMERLLNPQAGPDEQSEHSRLSHVLYRVLDGREDRDPDLRRREALLGDRYLLCSDGLSGVVDAQTIYEVLSEEAEPADAIRRLIQLARDGGGPDNITCVIADVVEGEPGSVMSEPQIVGAAGRL
ncbi:PP2C family protein-serine/threonine phosphatase [Thermomonospora catenispora]|uniref:PP2C family protein-serine/threonine phosphatase n=1 Tax=Thermomonospora catenispora TaxID=2493090 RepID=UPI00111FB5C0|nr:protein phosphatase 2C domain-containing protein [Thermomonospora catenispora]TNY35691.1 serine/threonine-protein phosphatase [Thermomonospora catenispora]